MVLQFGVYVESQEGTTWQDWREVAGRAEALGFDALASSVHLMSLAAPGRWTLDIWPVMTAIALWTERIRFGPLVLPVAFYHPVQVARLGAGLDRLSAGRFQLSLGAGRHAGEHRAFGLPFPEHDERVAILTEAVEAIRLLWRGEPVSFAGKWFHLREAELQPAPRRCSLGVGGNSEPVLRLAAAQADEWCTTSASPEELKRRNTRLDDLARAAGRRPQDISRTLMNGIVVGRDAAELERRAVRLSGTMPELAGEGAKVILERLAHEWGWWVGTVDEVAGQASAAAREGFDRLFFQLIDLGDLATLDLLAHEVMPRLRPELTARAR